LIGGSPKVGKTTLARKQADSMNAKLLSTDKLVGTKKYQVIFHGTAKKNVFTPQELMKGIIKEAEQIKGELDDIISKAYNSDHKIVIEGADLLPAYVAKLDRENIRSIFIGSTNIDLIISGMEKNTSQNNWLKNAEKKVLIQVAEFTKYVSEYLIVETKKYNLKYKERSNNFNNDITSYFTKIV